MRLQVFARARRFEFGWYKQVSIIAFLFLLAVPTVFAQQSTGTILGIVKDSSGATVPSANISVTDVDTNEVRTTITGADGAFRVSALQPGHYIVKSEKTGFKTTSATDLTLDVAEELVVNPSMEVGATTQEVVVSSEAPLVDTTTSSLGGLVNENEVSDLPLNGRNFVDLEQLQPGVVNNTNYTSGNAQGSNQGEWFSSNGAPLRSNNVTLDGAVMINMRGTIAAAVGVALGVDGIKEYKVITDSFSADYGLAMGSQVVIASKGGSNRFSGDVFEYLRNNALDARNYFDYSILTTGRRLPEFQRNNFGGSFGGPIKKDKTFFYAVYEGLRQNFGATIVDNVFAANCHVVTNNPCAITAKNPQGSVAPAIQPLLALFPSPNLPNNEFTYPATNPTTVDYGQIRVDHNFSAADSFFGRYTVQNSATGTLAKYPQFNLLTAGRDQFITLAGNHIFSPTLLNTVRASFSRTNIHVANQYFQDLTGPQYSFVPGLPIGDISVGGITGFGPTNTAPQLLLQNVYTLSDDIFYTRGRHSLKFGTLLNRFEDNTNITTAAQGTISFANAASFLAGLPTSDTALNPGSNENRRDVFYTIGFYGQDDFRLNSRITLNLGLRYEFMTTPADEGGRNYAFRNLTDPTTTYGSIMVNPSLKNFSPRVGFAWDVTGKGKTSVRAAWGKYYDLGNIGFVLYNQPQGTPPLSVQSSTTFPANLTQPITLPLVFTTPGNSLHTVLYHISQPYMMQENLTVEQQLPFATALSVSYVGSRGVHLWMAEEGNPCIPTSVTNGIPFWATNCGKGRLNPAWGSDILHTTNGDSNYNSLQVVVNKRLSHGLEFQSSYTWSKLIDVSQGEGGGGECISAGSNNIDYSLDKKRFGRGPSCFDATDNWRFNLLYHLPSVNSDHALARGLLSGWWTGGIVSWQTGFPFNPMVNTYRSLSNNLSAQSSTSQPDHASVGTATVAPGQVGPDGTVNTTKVTFIPYNKSTVITGNPNQWFNPLMFIPGTIGYLGTASRDMLRGPHLSDIDFSLNKDTAMPLLGENGKLVFRAEFFNILNHANFGMPNGVAYAGTLTDTSNYVETPLSTAGAITNTVTTSRQIQLALKLIF